MPPRNLGAASIGQFKTVSEDFEERGHAYHRLTVFLISRVIVDPGATATSSG